MPFTRLFPRSINDINYYQTTIPLGINITTFTQHFQLNVTTETTGLHNLFIHLDIRHQTLRSGSI